jgi:predicted small secreted protein
LARGALPRAHFCISGDINVNRIIGLTIAAAALMLAGCNTISGVGRDVSSVGSTVAKTADKHK